MFLKRAAQEFIHTLEEGGFYAVCPCCDEPMLLRHCGLFYLDDFTDKARSLYEQYKEELEEHRARLAERRKHISTSSEIQARATNIGFILERLAPSLSTFRFEAADCRSLFDPIDYVIFEGMRKKGRVSSVIFAEIKTGGSRLSMRQREIRELVRQQKVEFDVYEVLR